MYRNKSCGCPEVVKPPTYNYFSNTLDSKRSVLWGAWRQSWRLSHTESGGSVYTCQRWVSIKGSCSHCPRDLGVFLCCFLIQFRIWSTSVHPTPSSSSCVALKREKTQPDSDLLFRQTTCVRDLHSRNPGLPLITLGIVSFCQFK